MSIDLFECKGRMNFKVFNSKKKMIVQGSYINSLDTLKKYSTSRSAINGNKRIKVLSYFQPLPDGVWKYYSEGKQTKIVHYIRGVIE